LASFRKNLGEPKFIGLRITNQRVVDIVQQTKHIHTFWEAIMDAKWNNVVDNLAVRSLLLAVGFGVWLAISYGLLSL
jgi:hypothetical protein